MQPDIALDPPQQQTRSWPRAIYGLAAAWAALFALTFADWREMAHQWWNIDTYSHILLIPLIVGWLVWLRRDELAKVQPQAWWPGLLVVGAGLSVWLTGSLLDINLIAQVGTVLAFQGAVLALLGMRVAMLLAFPIAYCALLVPFGDEIIPQLQAITAKLATTLTVWSGVETIVDGIYINTPAGLFIVAEACSGVKFLIAMIALGILVAHTCFSSWNRRIWFLLACVIVPILANGVRAWATIYIAQYVGAEAAGGFDHIVYGWFFFGIVIALVLGVAWRWFERDPEGAGMTADEVAASPLVATFEGKAMSMPAMLAAILGMAAGFAVMARLVLAHAAMCGIAGIFHYESVKPVDPRRVELMTNALAHRGPDGSGVWTAPGVGLGHRRLSIIDLAGSPQPMLSADGRAAIVFNGEIYNFRALRRELERDGAVFRTDGDTETILAAWQKWGVDCLPRLDGMFAFALYDLDRRQLFLARDRLGVKPLYIARLEGGAIGFASELKGILAHPMMRREIDPLAIEDYMTWGYVPDHRAILKGVEKLPAGHFMLLEHGRELPAPQQWWDVSFEHREQGSTADHSAQLLHLMREGVASRMVADVPLGAFLSGGVDSSSVVALMSEASNRPVTSCSIGFDVQSVDETSYARQVAERFATDHHERIVSADQFGEIDRIARIFDEPFADASALPTLRVCELAREHVTVALSGDGADEAFAGYRRQIFQMREEQVRRLLPASLRQPVFGTLGKVFPKADWAPRPLRAKATLLSLARSGAEGYARALSILAPEQRGALYGDALLHQRGDYRAEQPLIEMMDKAPARSGLDRAQYADLKFWMPGDILTKSDRASMAVGLEAREPLLDHRLIEFAARLPERERIRGTTGKWLMKHTMERYLPEDILYRQKQGFVTPLAQWFRGPLADEARAVVSSGMLVNSGWFDRRALSRLADNHISGRSDNSRVLWQLLMLERSLAHLRPSA